MPTTCMCWHAGRAHMLAVLISAFLRSVLPQLSGPSMLTAGTAAGLDATSVSAHALPAWLSEMLQADPTWLSRTSASSSASILLARHWIALLLSCSCCTSMAGCADRMQFKWDLQEDISLHA